MMSMREPTSFFVSRNSLDRCHELVDSGEFNSISEVFAYSMRLFSENLRIGSATNHIQINRDDIVKVSFRTDKYVLDRIMSSGFERNVIADESISFYLDWRKRFRG